MADPTGDDVAVLLLRVLPAEVAELVLARMDEPTAGRLRTRLKAPIPEPTAPDIDAALVQFFDLQRIAERAAPPVRPAERPAPAAEASPLEPKPAGPRNATAIAQLARGIVRRAQG